MIELTDLSSRLPEIVSLVRDPRANIAGSLVLLLAVVIIGLMIALTIIAIVTSTGSRKRRERQRRELAELWELQSLMAAMDAEEGEPVVQPRGPVVFEERYRYPWLAAAGVTIAAFLLIGVALGVTTSSSSTCQSCHTTTPHTEGVRAGMKDAHVDVECVLCHESSGPIGRATIEVPARIAHFVNGGMNDPRPSQYGHVVSSPCLSCHGEVKRVTTTDVRRGVRMSHKEPLEAGAQCRDCHKADTGVVSALTVGMTPCLRCHDGKKQSSECATCHTKDVGAATAPRLHATEGKDLIPTPDCGSCHDQEKSCDPCHGGVRMPHTDLFMWWGHAREGAKDAWFNNGEACGRCHTATRRPCTGCHAFFPGHPKDSFPQSHGNVKGGATSSACSGCHNPKAHTPGRDFCKMCHEQPYITQ